MIEGTPSQERIYKFADHLVRSSYPLPTLPLVDVDVTAWIGPILHVKQPVEVEDLPMRTAWLHEWRDNDGEPSLQVAQLSQAPEQLLLRIPGYCDFRLSPLSGDVAIDVVASTGPDTLEHLLIDQALPRLLTQRGALVLHASVVQIEGRTALFLGRSGWGKSTLAALLYRRGAHLLSDDCAVLVMEAGAVRAVPTYPSLRLFADSISNTFGAAPELTSVSEYSSKQRVGVHATGAERKVPVDVIYLLGDPASAPAMVKIAQLPSATACMALVEHNFQLDPTSRSLTRAQLQRAAEALATTPAYSLQFPRTFDQADTLVDSLLMHLSSSTPRDG